MRIINNLILAYIFLLILSIFVEAQITPSTEPIKGCKGFGATEFNSNSLKSATSKMVQPNMLKAQTIGEAMNSTQIVLVPWPLGLELQNGNKTSDRNSSTNRTVNGENVSSNEIESTNRTATSENISPDILQWVGDNRGYGGLKPPDNNT